LQGFVFQRIEVCHVDIPFIEMNSSPPVRKTPLAEPCISWMGCGAEDVPARINDQVAGNM
jgi:hypothetical protein